MIEKHSVLEIMTPLIEKLPLNDQDFSLVRVDLDKTKFETDGSRRLIAIFAALAGVLMTAFVWPTRHDKAKRQINTPTLCNSRRRRGSWPRTPRGASGL